MHDRDLLHSIIYYLDRLWEAAPIKLTVATVVALGGWLATPGVTQAAIWLLIADWATGVLKAMLLRQVHSAAGVRGAVKSLIYLGLLAVGVMLGAAGPLAAEVTQWVALLVIYTEAVSNLENLDAIAAHFGADVPILRQVIGVLRMRAEQAPGGGTGPLPTLPTDTTNGGTHAVND